MATENSLGRLQRVGLRDVWEREAEGFTPWLAREENLELLSETVGIELELEGQERSVGPFRADILCKDLATGSWVLIENQLERTDHTHLGQLLTYAAGLQAVTILWIAQRFTEEHRATLDWLNEITDERFNFFGLEVELWRIGESAIAPKFNVVCKPNDWSRSIAESASQIEAGQLSTLKQLQVAYWSAFWEQIKRSDSRLKGMRAVASQWLSFSIGRTGFGVYAYLNARGGWIEARMVTTGPLNKAHFAEFERQRNEIEAEFGQSLNWEPLPEAKETRISIRLAADVEARADWPRQHEWLQAQIERLHQVFARRVREVQAIESTPEVDGIVAQSFEK